MKFFKQKKKLRNLNLDELPFYDSEKETRDKPYIQMQESLTEQSGKLLRKLKEHLSKFEGDEKWDYPGYVAFGGQIRAKMHENQKPVTIRCMSDIKRLGPKRQP